MRSPLPRLEMKASRAPSGDQAGRVSLCSPEVNGRGELAPSTAASQTWLRYSLASASIRVTTKATVSPSGESAGEPTVIKWSRSVGSMGPP